MTRHHASPTPLASACSLISDALSDWKPTASAAGAAVICTTSVALGFAGPSQAESLQRIFAPPTAAERKAVLDVWAEPVAPATRWTVEDSFEDDGFRLDIVSQRVEGNRHFSAVRTPQVYRPGQPAPILVLNHGGWDGIEGDWAFELVDDCLADFFVVVPSFRGEELRIFDDTYQSTGEKSLINRDVIDVMALISGVVDNYPGAQDHDVSAWGYSRGGGVSLMLGIRDPRVDRVVNVFGPTDVLTYPDMINGVIGHLRGEEVSPYYGFPGTFVEAYYDGQTRFEELRMQLLGGSALHFADLLPERVQTHHGARDTIVPVGNARALDQALMRRSDMITSEYFEYRFGGHGALPGLNQRATRMLCADR